MLQRHPALQRALSLILSLAIILSTFLSVVSTGGKAEAAASLPYIEELKNSQTGGAFKILEIAPSAREGSIGYYVGGYEPCQYFPSLAAEDSSCYATDSNGTVTPGNHQATRIEKVQAMYTGITKAGILSAGTTTPLTKAANYSEVYPWQITKDPTLASTYINTLTLRKGSTASDIYYEKVGADSGGGVTGIKFTAKPNPLPDGEDVTDYAYNIATRYTLNTSSGTYVQDVSYFTADGDQITQLQNAGDQIFYYAPTFQNISVVVTPDADANGNATGTQTITATYLKDGVQTALPDNTAIYANEADYSSTAPSDTAKNYNYYYLGNYSSNSSENTVTLDDAHTYYFVSAAGTPTDVEPSSQTTAAKSSYAAVSKSFHVAASGETPYFTPEGGKEAYKYVGAGQGSYKCEAAPGDNTQYILYTNTVYYPKCYTNNEWFKKNVFNYEDSELTSMKVNFVVETLAPDDAALTTDELDSASLIFVSNGLKLSNTGTNSAAYSADLTAADLSEIETLTTRGTSSTDTPKLVTPLIVDSRIASSGKPNLITLAGYTTDTLGAGAANRVRDNVYYFVKGSSTEFATATFNTALTAYSDDPSEPYKEVAEAIRRTNNQRLAQNPSAATVSTTISMAAVIRHIINAAQPTSNKQVVRVLDIEPGNPYGGTGTKSVLTSETVTNTWLKGQGFTGASITTWSTSEFIARFNQTTYNSTTKTYETTDLTNSFDIIYIGTNIDRFANVTYDNTGLNQTVVNYKDSNMVGLVYSNIGDKVKSGGSGLLNGTGYTLSGSLNRDYQNSDPTSNVIQTSTSDQFRFSGNDLTANAKAFLETFAGEGHPVVAANDIYNKINCSSNLSSGNLRFGYARDGWLIDYSGSINILNYSYAITANKTILTVSASIGNLSTNSDDIFRGVKSTIKSWLENIKQNIEHPTIQWYVSYDGTNYTAISGATGTTLDISSYGQNCYFYCTAALPETKGSYSTLTATYSWGITNSPAARSQVVKLTKNAVNDDRVDSSSYMYEFLNDIKARTNVFSEGDFTTDNKPNGSAAAGKCIQLSDLVNISAPSIVFTADADSKPVNYTYNVDDSGNITGMSSITPDANGKCSLTYKFTIDNPTDQALNATRYGCNLYVDENGDGHFADSEKLSNVDVYCDDRRVTSLQTSSAAKTYTYSISRPMPDNFCGVIPWKLEIYKIGSENVTASQTGFSHISSSDTRPKKALNILQLTPNDYTYNTWLDGYVKSYEQSVRGYNTIHFADSADACNQMLKSNPDYDITVTELELNTNYTDNFATLDKYDMLILGFGNSYGEMTQASANAISQFIATGKAVLFSDDCASTFFASSRDATLDNGLNLYGSSLKSMDIFNLFAVGYHGYYFNTTLRDAVGLDRYGVSSQSVVKASGNDAAAYYNARTSLTGSGYSMAYTPKSGRGSTVPETQGLTNNILMAKYKDSASAYPYGYYPVGSADIFSEIATRFKTWDETTFQDMATTNTVTQVNKGQITSYPYNVNTGNNGGNKATNGIEDDFIKVQTTHMQAMQLNMNRSDVYVWYCLAGNSTDSSTLGSTYNYNTNDATNQYYIYSRGNVTYTGAGHFAPSTMAEKELIVNTIIAAARQGQTAPTAAFTDPDGGKTNITNVLIPANNGDTLSSSASTDISRRIYFKLQDTSLVPTTSGKTFSAVFSYKVGSNSAQSISIPVYTSSGNAADSTKMDVSQTYYVKLDDLLNYSDIKNHLGDVQFQITPSVSITGTKNPYAGNPISVTLNQMDLFKLG